MFSVVVLLKETFNRPKAGRKKVKKVAKKVGKGNSELYRGKAFLYEISPPIDGRNFVIVSIVPASEYGRFSPYTEDVTTVFLVESRNDHTPCDEQPEGFNQAAEDKPHDEALLDLGYRLVDELAFKGVTAIFAAASGSFEQRLDTFHRLYKEGTWEELFPGFNAQDGCGQSLDVHAEGDVLRHVALVFAHAVEAGQGLNPRQQYLLYLAALIHDMEKPATRAVRDGGRVTFYGHAERAAERCPKFARIIGLDENEAECLQYLVAEHMRVHDLPPMSDNKRLAYYRSPYFVLLALLQEADARASWRNADGSLYGEVHREFFAEDRASLLAQAAKKEAEAALRKRVTTQLQERGVPGGQIYGRIGSDALKHFDPTHPPSDQEVSDWLDEKIG